MLHIGYRGIDIKLDYNIKNDRYTTRCDTYTNGSYELFSLIGLTVPTLEMPSGRLSIPFNGILTFIRSTCLTEIQQSGCGAIIAYRLKQSSQWMMGVVICYRYNQPTNLNYTELYEFVNVVDKDGIPSILRCDKWESMTKLLRYQMYYLEEVELFILNQVRPHFITLSIFMRLSPLT